MRRSRVRSKECFHVDARRTEGWTSHLMSDAEVFVSENALSQGDIDVS
jgi:hypothetical protein